MCQQSTTLVANVASCGLGNACTASDIDGCSGAKLQFCAIDTVDCTSLGFAGCSEGRCTP